MRYDVALEVELDVDLLPALHGRAGPNAVVVLLEAGNLRIAAGFDLRLGGEGRLDLMLTPGTKFVFGFAPGTGAAGFVALGDFTAGV